VREGLRLVESNIKNFARQLRKNQTEMESRPWQCLRDRRLVGYKFRRQHLVKEFILDFYCPEKKLAVEMDGGQHDSPDQMAYDQNRTKILEKEGIKVLRYWDNETYQNLNGVLDDILVELEHR
jgi:very-short-patch-repair endonuclease